jgi:hypothetical protein
LDGMLLGGVISLNFLKGRQNHRCQRVRLMLQYQEKSPNRVQYKAPHLFV